MIDVGVKFEFRDVYTGVTLGPIAVGTARKEKLQYAEAWVHGRKNGIWCNATHGTSTVRNTTARPQ